jgi:lactobin A/cerein 7B family class IIb bacteriocin
MNANETTEIRELTAQELDEVNGGVLGLVVFAAYCFVLGMGIGGNGGAVDFSTDGYTGW